MASAMAEFRPVMFKLHPRSPNCVFPRGFRVRWRCWRCGAGVYPEHDVSLVTAGERNRRGEGEQGETTSCVQTIDTAVQ